MLERFQLLRNVGQFDSVDAGAQLPLTKLTLVYAENGRGKTTLAAILRSLSKNDGSLISERHRLGAALPPHVVLKFGGFPQSLVFQGGNWSAANPRLMVFDDLFVAENVCSGIEIETGHRQNLHELILGAQGVALNGALQAQVSAIEQHNRALRDRAEAIPAAARGAMTVEAFCELEEDPGVAQKIREAERALAAARSAEAVQREQGFGALALPTFDVAAIDALLRRDLPGLEAEAVAKVQAHFAALGPGGENWVGDGVRRIGAASVGKDHEACPFCAQNLRGSPLVAHYRAYFSEAYGRLKSDIADRFTEVANNHGGDVLAAFERAIRVAIQRRDFWKAFTDVPDIAVDTAAVARAWNIAREGVLRTLRAKQSAPLDLIELSAEVRQLIVNFDELRTAIAEISDALQAINKPIAIVKERAAAANIATLTGDLAKLRAVETRHSPAVAPLCHAYLGEVAAKAATEAMREQARTALDQYRRQVFPAYETAINAYLAKINAGFRLARVESVNTRAGSSASYCVLINNVPVSLVGGAGAPSFRNTLSSGDRNTLALAFFFASLDRDAQLAQKAIIIDDPMTSLDEHRSLTTIQEIRRLLDGVEQVIVLSHSKPFLSALWDSADTTTRSAIKITREGAGSTLGVWDVRQDSITQHDKRHQMIAAYFQNSNAADQRAVATALRLILESFMRVAYPEAFPPDTLLGHFINLCEQRLNARNELLNGKDISELRDLLDYANKFHHDSNPAWETEIINDQQLLYFARRALAFTRRP